MEVEWGVYRNSLYYLLNFSVSLKLFFKKKVINLKKKVRRKRRKADQGSGVSGTGVRSPSWLHVWWLSVLLVQNSSSQHCTQIWAKPPYLEDVANGNQQPELSSAQNRSYSE